MKILGIIAEYNPFHNGHKYHISQAIRQTGAQGVIIALSGNYVQRGEAALAEKYTRARFAVEHGADLVLELPVLFSSASAEYFAIGAVSLLQATGLVTHLSFGCEHTDLTKLEQAAAELAKESPGFQSRLKTAMDTGLSYAKARITALEETLQIPGDLLSSPNAILAIEYLKAIYQRNAAMIAVPVYREGSGYHALQLDHPYPSAAALRRYIDQNRTTPLAEFLSPYLPSSVGETLQSLVQSGSIPDQGKLDYHLLSCLRNSSPETLRRLPYVTEGLENRLIRSANTATTLPEFFSNCASSRYPTARIRRILTSILTGVTAALLEEGKQKGAPYIKVLAFNETGRKLLKDMKKAATLPIITKPAAFHSLSGFAAQTAAIEVRATDAYFLSLCQPKAAGQEFYAMPYYT